MFVNIFKHLLWNHWVDWSQISWDGGTKVCSIGPDHMTKMAAMPINSIFFSKTKRPMTLKLGKHHRVPKYYQVCLNVDTELTLACFMSRWNLVHYAFVWKRVKTMAFSETMISFGRWNHLNEYIRLYEYQRSRSFIDLGPSHSCSIFSSSM